MDMDIYIYRYHVFLGHRRKRNTAYPRHRNTRKNIIRISVFSQSGDVEFWALSISSYGMNSVD